MRLILLIWVCALLFAQNVITTVPANLFDAQTSLNAVSFNGNALDATGVNNVLASIVVCCSSPSTNGTVDLSGGTNAAPSGQGIVDVATLVTAGWEVTTN